MQYYYQKKLHLLENYVIVIVDIRTHIVPECLLAISIWTQAPFKNHVDRESLSHFIGEKKYSFFIFLLLKTLALRSNKFFQRGLSFYPKFRAIFLPHLQIKKHVK